MPFEVVGQNLTGLCKRGRDSQENRNDVEFLVLSFHASATTVLSHLGASEVRANFRCGWREQSRSDGPVM